MTLVRRGASIVRSRALSSSTVRATLSLPGKTQLYPNGHRKPARPQPASWHDRGVERDLRTIHALQALRAFLYGFGSVLFGSVLAEGGLTDAQVGLVFSAMLAGLAITSAGVGWRGERIGRRRLYASLFVVLACAGTVVAFTTLLPLVILAALTGTLSTDPNESGPITSLEQAMLGEAPPDLRTRVFGSYNAIAYLAGSVGALAAGVPALLRESFPAVPPDQRWLLAFPIVGLFCFSLTSRLSHEVEAGRGDVERGLGGDWPAEHRPRPALSKSKGVVAKLASLFALDSFAGGFVVQSFLVFWFQRKYGATVQTMGLVFFAAGLLQAGSSVAAGRLAHRIGMLNTMVFTHLPSNVLLVLVPFAPTLGTAIALLLLRFAISQMDVPARQAYVVAVVDPEERTAAAAYTNTARYVPRPAGPILAGVLMQNVALAAPFVVAGSLKIVYDLLIFATFRRVPLPSSSSSRPSS